MSSHRELIEACLSGQRPARVPVALWRHFPVDDQRPERLAAATLAWQQAYDFDFVKVTPASSYCLKDWGVEDRWRGNMEGTREYTKRVIRSPEDWRTLPVLDALKGHLGAQLECLRLIIEELGDETPVIQTIFNPMAQAKNLIGGEQLLVHMRRYPEALHEGLKIITESTAKFVEAARETGIAGIFFATQHAQYGLLSEAEYQDFGRRYDLQVFAPANDLWLNVLHLHGTGVMFPAFLDYPVAVINWHDQDTPPSLAEAQEQFSGVVCGGLRQWEDMAYTDAGQVQTRAAKAIQSTRGKRFILGTGCVTPIVAPHGNLQAVRQAVE